MARLKIDGNPEHTKRKGGYPPKFIEIYGPIITGWFTDRGLRGVKWNVNRYTVIESDGR
jgi:hypothetical protein